MVEYIENKQEESKINLPYPLGFYTIHFLGVICGISLIMILFSYFYLESKIFIVWLIIFMGSMPPVMRLK
jgi:hypothetical protein